MTNPFYLSLLVLQPYRVIFKTNKIRFMIYILLYLISEIRQEAVKAALAMYQKQQPLIISTKRNTTYLMSLMNSTKINKDDLTNNKTNISNENPFPVSHITVNGSDFRIAGNIEPGS